MLCGNQLNYGRSCQCFLIVCPPFEFSILENICQNVLTVRCCSAVIKVAYLFIYLFIHLHFAILHIHILINGKNK